MHLTESTNAPFVLWNVDLAMKRQELLLAILAAAEGRSYTPVQIQKAVFLVTENLPKLVTEGRNYEFEPYDFGPFDVSVYNDATTLSSAGLAEISRVQNTGWKEYAASDEGIEVGQKILAQMSRERRDYIESVAKWVRKQSFGQLVKSIYEAYPKMKVNSIFKG